MARLLAARVRDGVIVADDLDLPDGTAVLVAVDVPDETCSLSPDELAELDAALADADRSDPVPFDDVLADFDRLQAAASR